MFDLLRTTPLGRMARHARWVIGGVSQEPLLTGRLSVRTAPTVMEVETPAAWVVRVENHSRRIWARSGPGRVMLRHRWTTRTGEGSGPVCEMLLPRTLLPGDWADVPVSVLGPATVGDFTLTWDLTATDEDPGEDLRERVPVHIDFPRASDIDYHLVYRTADLEANSWWVVGAYHSQDEYLRSSRARREMLIGCGLTPDSRVLDIGCGTGQMAMALQDYLTPRGAYYGTDIAQEGIEYCQRTFRRPNFVFARGEMTRIPFPEAIGFDLAIFFSVFTHTFVDESVLLLGEVRKRLAVKGSVVADVIASEHVARGAGHRGQMWVNRDHFVRLAESLGFTTEVLGTSPWSRGAERVMFRFKKVD